MVTDIFIIFTLVMQIFGSSITKICKIVHMNFDISVCLASCNILRRDETFLLKIDIDFAKFLLTILLIF